MQVWTNLCDRESFSVTNCWQELHFEFSRQNLNRNVQSPSLWWWLITQSKPIWKKAPPGLQRPSRADSGISGVLYWPKLPVPHLGPDPRLPWGLDPPSPFDYVELFWVESNSKSFFAHCNLPYTFKEHYCIDSRYLSFGGRKSYWS